MSARYGAMSRRRLSPENGRALRHMLIAFVAGCIAFPFVTAALGDVAMALIFTTLVLVTLISLSCRSAGPSASLRR